METTASREPLTWREGRRLRAWELFQAGWKIGEIAAALGVTHGAVSQWRLRAETGGREALHARKPPGKPTQLTAAQLARLPELLARGAEDWGFVDERWTRARVAEVIRREFAVHHHPAHVSRLLARIDWTLQRPARHARERDEAAVTQWREETQPALEKGGLNPRRR